MKTKQLQTGIPNLDALKPMFESEQPIFTIYTEDGEINIFFNGKVTGVSDWQGGGNFIPAMIQTIQAIYSLHYESKKKEGRPMTD